MSAVMLKLRRPGERRFSFLTPRGGSNHLRVHGSIFEDKDGRPGEERAAGFVDRVSVDHPGWEWKIVNAHNGE